MVDNEKLSLWCSEEGRYLLLRGRGEGEKGGAMEWRDHCGEMRGIERDKDTMENTGGYEYRGYEGQRRERIREENISAIL